MKKIVFALTCALLFGCAAAQQPEADYEGIVFNTGKSRKAVMDAIIKVVHDDGFTVGAVNENHGTILCKPRPMLNGVLMEKIEGKKWNLQTKTSTFNHQIRFSATVGINGAVNLKTLVSENREMPTIDCFKSNGLARYYERKILETLRLPMP